MWAHRHPALTLPTRQNSKGGLFRMTIMSRIIGCAVIFLIVLTRVLSDSGTIIAWALFGVAVAVLTVITFTFIESNPQGPLALIIDAPLGATVGILFGHVTYVLAKLDRNRRK
jgi:hypothetical protein